MPAALLPSIFLFFCDVAVSAKEVQDVADQLRRPRSYARSSAARSWEQQERPAGGRFGSIAPASSSAPAPPPLADAAAAPRADGPGQGQVAPLLGAQGHGAVVAAGQNIYDGLSRDEMKECLRARDARVLELEQEAIVAKDTARNLQRSRDC